MTQAEYIAALRAKLDAEIAEAKIGQGKPLDDRYHEGEADGYLEGLEFARNLLAPKEDDEARYEPRLARPMRVTAPKRFPKPNPASGPIFFDSQREIYNEGTEAYRAGVARDDSPYGSLICRGRWQRGWDEAATGADADPTTGQEFYMRLGKRAHELGISRHGCNVTGTMARRWWRSGWDTIGEN